MASKFQIFCDADIHQLAATVNATKNISADDDNNGQATNQQNLKQQLSSQNEPFNKQQHPQQLKERHYANHPNYAKREPLAVKRLEPVKLHIQQPSQSQSQPLSLYSTNNQQQQHFVGINNQQSSQSNSQSSQCNVSPDEDQENNISMVSLGSDFEPSIIHHSYRSHELTDDDEAENYYGEESIRLEESFQADEDICDTDDYDDEMLMELDAAFEEHDSSIAYKNIDYVADIMEYLYKLERTPEVRPHPSCIKAQTIIDSAKRTTLIDWMVEVAEEYHFQTETLFISINLIDRFLSQVNVSLDNFQLVGVAAMFIASKYEEIYPPDLHQFVEVTDETYSGKQIRMMELQLLTTLNFRLSMPTSVFFIREILTFNKFTKQVFHLAEYLCYLAQLEDEPFLEYYPSEIAYAAVILAANELNAAAKISPELKNAFDKSNIDQLCRIEKNQSLPLCVESLLRIQKNARSYRAVFVKFSSEEHESVALIKPCVDLTQVVA